MSNTQTNQKGLLYYLNIISILGLGVATCGNCANLVLNDIIAYFSDFPMTTVYLISTIPSFATLIFSLAIGPFVGRKVGYKPVAIVGYILFIVGGILPAFEFVDNLYFILALRLLVGLGIGFLSFSNPMIIASFEGQEQAKILGWATVASKLLLTIATQIGGWLGTISWRTAFFQYAMAALPLLLTIFFMQEPESSRGLGFFGIGTKNKVQKVETVQEKTRIRVGKTAIFWIAFQSILLMLIFPAYTSVSIYTNALGYDATVSAIIITCYEIGGFIGALVFSSLLKILKRFYVPVFVSLVTIGFILMYFCRDSIFLIYLGMGLSGIGFAGLGPMEFYFMGATEDTASMPFIGSLFTSCIFGVASITGYYIAFVTKLTGDGVFGHYLVAIIGSAIMVLGSALVDLRPRQLR